jgi:hypothetical protein
MIGIFHDPEELEMLADEILPVKRPELYEDDIGRSSDKSRKEFIFQVQ